MMRTKTPDISALWGGELSAPVQEHFDLYRKQCEKDHEDETDHGNRQDTGASERRA